MTGIVTTQVVALDGTCSLGRDRLGGKAASIDRMRSLGLPGPPAFAITTDVCARFRDGGGELPDDVWAAALDALAGIERATGHAFGDPSSPLLVSVRSGAAQSMPGMMDTVLNLGLTRELTDALATQTGDPAWARDTWERFCRSYAEVVGLDDGATEPPPDPWRQLRTAIGAVFRSWDSPRARVYRDRHGIDHDLGTAVTVQAMVFGNRDAHSGTGVVFSRDPRTGEPGLYGEWMARGQGEDVVSGVVTPAPVSALAQEMPAMHAGLRDAAARLEAEYRDMVDIEFTVESGQLHVLQVRPGKRSAAAAVRVAVGLAEEGVIDRDTALARVGVEQAEALTAAAGADVDGVVLARGTAAGPGVAVGLVVTDPDDALDADEDEPVVLVRPHTAPDDVPAMYASVAVVTEHGGTTSHAALVAREAGLPCVVGCGEGTLAALAGRRVTVDGARGVVLEGDVLADRPATGRSEHETALHAWAAARLGEDGGSASLSDLLARVQRIL
ncbi:pyruvate, phosphate dikinase [Actinomycetospora rhizophila]|uniref:Pyruvate, phosphate dikinase n=1 Tax=Actinomycetospora rhizophila TaxID=1416876 RepID=A0ABV9ZBH2_9PSEU